MASGRDIGRFSHSGVRRTNPVTNHNVFRDGKVHVMKEMCKTCVFRPGNLMQLEPGRLAGMVNDAVEDASTIVCHSTLYLHGPPEHAGCKGFFDRHATAPLQIAQHMGLIEWVETDS
jgi:hypothetical protein